jgi:hypothetical protein
LSEARILDGHHMAANPNCCVLSSLATRLFASCRAAQR